GSGRVTRASTHPSPSGRLTQPPALIKKDMTDSTAELMLDAGGIAKAYGAVVALRDASLAVRSGEVHALMGANGAGKSTFVKILTGAVRPDRGRIKVRGRESTASSPREARRLGLVSVYQEPSLLPDLDLRSNLRLTHTPTAHLRPCPNNLRRPPLVLSTLSRARPLALSRH